MSVSTFHIQRHRCFSWLLSAPPPPLPPGRIEPCIREYKHDCVSSKIKLAADRMLPNINCKRESHLEVVNRRRSTENNRQLLQSTLIGFKRHANTYNKFSFAPVVIHYTYIYSIFVWPTYTILPTVPISQTKLNRRQMYARGRIAGNCRS